jgi:hypothetical protein
MECRMSPRVPVTYPILYFNAPVNAPPTRMLDLSETGAQLESLRPLPIGAVVSFIVIARKNEAVEARANVIHVSPTTNDMYRVGVRFCSVAADLRSLLPRLM